MLQSQTVESNTLELLKSLMQKEYLNSFVLVGGTANGNWNVFARNPTTGVYGQVCDDSWDLNDVRIV